MNRTEYIATVKKENDSYFYEYLNNGVLNKVAAEKHNFARLEPYTNKEVKLTYSPLGEFEIGDIGIYRLAVELP